MSANLGTVTITTETYGRARRQATVPAWSSDLDFTATAQALIERTPASGGYCIGGWSRRDVAGVERDLRAACERVWATAERTSRVVAEVVDDGTGVGAVARVHYEATGRDVHRGADEGGSFRGQRYWGLAAEEAEERALRAAGGDAARIVRRGYVAPCGEAS